MRLANIGRWYIFFAAIVMSLTGAALCSAGDYDGWEAGSEYNSLYDSRERDSIKGDIAKFITVTPLEGMAPGTAFLLDEGDGEKIVVHVCPEAYATGRETGLRRGDWVKVKGVWADVGDE